MLLQLLGSNLQFLVPVFAELADKGFAQEFIDGHVLLAAQKDSRFANVPTMVVHRLVRTVIAYADGVQMTGNGLVEVGLTGTKAFSMAQ